jgi:hypothetical protein
MTYTLSFAFLETFRIPIEIGASFNIAEHTIWITAIHHGIQRVDYAVTDKIE